MFRNPLIFSLLTTLFLAVAACGENDPPEPVLPESTVIVYMAASNNLKDYARNNINQMEEAMTDDGRNLLVYLDVPGEMPRVLRIQHDNSPTISSPAVINYSAHNSASPQTMKKVLEDIRTAYPSDSYGLILWSHASSWMPPGTQPTTLAFGDDGGDQMDLRDLKNALPGTYEYIVFDACSMASVEVVYELRGKTDRILASPTETIASGMPYHLVLPHFFEGKKGLQTVAEKYVEYYGQQDGLYRSATVSLIDTRQLNGLASAARTILENGGFTDPDYHRSEVQRLDFESDPATESYDFLDFFQKNLPPSSLQPLEQQLAKAVLFERHTAEFLGEPINEFCGLTCYIPHAGDDFINDYYKTLEWSQASGFNLLIR